MGSICAANLTFKCLDRAIGSFAKYFLFTLILWLINKKILHFNPRSLAFSFFGGHPQTTLYVFILSGIYLIYSKVSLKLIVIIYIFALAISSVQLLPTIELYKYSARKIPLCKNLLRQPLFRGQI